MSADVDERSVLREVRKTSLFYLVKSPVLAGKVCSALHVFCFSKLVLFKKVLLLLIIVQKLVSGTLSSLELTEFHTEMASHFWEKSILDNDSDGPRTEMAHLERQEVCLLHFHE